MCLIALAWRRHPQHELVLVSNRDEFHARPSLALAPWEDLPQICGGRDLVSGGSWLALHSSGRLAAVTNVRMPPPPQAEGSRGHLVRDFLQGTHSAEDFARQLQSGAARYAPFNLLLWDGRSLVAAGNQPAYRWQSLTPGVYGVSNGGFDEGWPKTRALKSALHLWLDDRAALDAAGIEPLFSALAARQPAPDAELPDTGVGLERERWLSAPFVQSPRYGTRASSLVAITAGQPGLLVERRFDPQGSPSGETRLCWPLPAADADAAQA